jgi:AraC-like DNA-binding protein
MYAGTTMQGMGEFSQLLLGVCAGALLAMAAAMLRAPRPAARWSGFAFFFCSALFAIKLWNDLVHAIPPEFGIVIGVTAMTSVGWFWLMVMALFGDVDRYRPVMFLAPLAMMLCGIANIFRIAPFIQVMWVVTTLLQVTLAIWSIVIVMRSWKDDLVESRRRLRGPFMVAVALYIISLNGFDVLEMLGVTPNWYPTLNAAMFAGVVLAGALVFLDPREAMFGSDALPAEPPTPRPVSEVGAHVNGKAPAAETPAPALDRAAKADLERLQCLMSRDEVWKEEGLTIASLALRAAMPETQLRRLINDCLGYRNFPSYVNAHRIAAAKARLADPNGARVSISAIAYETGFASLGPFNRAFKEEAGVSPSEWRRKALGDDPTTGEASPISEIA